MAGKLDQLPSLLSELGDADAIGSRRAARRTMRDRLNALDARARSLAASLWTNPRRRLIAVPTLALLLVGGGVGTWLAVRFRQPPDYKTARIDLIFDYTLLTDDFNKLPIEQRQRLIGELIKRVSDMQGSESGMLAAFAAGIYGNAREQLEENVSRLMLDTADVHAAGYTSVPPEERGEYLDQAVLSLMKMAEAVSGQTSDESDEQRLTDAREQAQRDAEFIKSGELSAQAAGTMFLVLDRGIGEHASAHQRARISTMLRDMTDRLRAPGPP
jgi:hypothetical protein